MGSAAKQTPEKKKQTSPKPKAGKKPAAKPVKATKKAKPPAKKTEKKPKKNIAKIENLTIDFCGVKLTAKQKDFITRYVTPGQPGFHNGFRAATDAGYSKTTARAEIYIMLRNPDIQKIIKKAESIFYQDFHSHAMRARELKVTRAFHDPMDFFKNEEVTIETKKGKFTKKVLTLKPMEEMTLEQRLCIDGIDVKGPGAVPIYLTADRGKELNDVIRMDEKMTGSGLGDGQDVEETKEIIMERVIIRREKRKKEVVETAEYQIIEPDRAGIEEEL